MVTISSNTTKLDGLQTREQVQLLDVIDALRAEGLAEYTSLPQLIVCGDQSSGKSSVLEAISGVPFPRKETLCTRFATEVILRRAQDESISVSMVPGSSRSPRERKVLQDFRFDLSGPNEFPTLFEKAHRAMGLDSPSSEAFSEDVLRVEVSGPTQPQLTVVDLPGLIHSENQKQSARDVRLVHELVESYMKNKRSIILAVVSAMNEFANQIVLAKARNVDPDGERTIGIITKPDTLSFGTTSEKAFLTLARNEDIKFERGWHVVRNLDLGAGEGGVKDRDTEEALFFQNSSFKSLPPKSVGISSLRCRLSEVLFRQVQSELPKLIQDIDTGIADTRARLDKLGASRATLQEQRAFLIRTSQEFQMLSRDAINGQYGNPFFENDLNIKRRLCAVIANSHDVFRENLIENGSQWIVAEKKGRNHKEKSSPRYRTPDEAVAHIQVLLRKSRGRELPGLVNPLLVGEVFRQYSQPWEGIARSHLRSVWQSTNAFLEQVLHHLTDADVTQALLSELLSPEMEIKLQHALAKLSELIAVYRDQPATLSPGFEEKVLVLQEARRIPSFEQRMRDVISRKGAIDENNITSLLSTLKAGQEVDLNCKAAEGIYDNMKAYYDTAIQVFLDNVPSLVIQETVVNHVPRMFCPESVFAMEDSVVGKVASESEDKVHLRQELARKLATLETGHHKCKQYVSRESLVKNIEVGMGQIDSPKTPLSGQSSVNDDGDTSCSLDDVDEHGRRTRRSSDASIVSVSPEKLENDGDYSKARYPALKDEVCIEAPLEECAPVPPPEVKEDDLDYYPTKIKKNKKKGKTPVTWDDSN